MSYHFANRYNIEQFMAYRVREALFIGGCVSLEDHKKVKLDFTLLSSMTKDFKLEVPKDEFNQVVDKLAMTIMKEGIEFF